MILKGPKFGAFFIILFINYHLYKTFIFNNSISNASLYKSHLRHFILSNYDRSLANAPVLEVRCAVHSATILFLKSRTAMTLHYSFSLFLLGIAKLALIDTANVVLWQKVSCYLSVLVCLFCLRVSGIKN